MLRRYTQDVKKIWKCPRKRENRAAHKEKINFTMTAMALFSFLLLLQECLRDWQ